MKIITKNYSYAIEGPGIAWLKKRWGLYDAICRMMDMLLKSCDMEAKDLPSISDNFFLLKFIILLVNVFMTAKAAH